MKKYETIACCGIDCGLCPRYNTSSASACPGCGGAGFREKHPSCGFHSCCVLKKGLEVCSDCPEYPCKRFESEKNGFDSFVTHRKVFTNLGFIQKNGMEAFIKAQKIRMDILKEFLEIYDDGRSKSFFCLACTLLPTGKLSEASETMRAGSRGDLKDKNRQLREILNNYAHDLGMELRLNQKK